MDGNICANPRQRQNARRVPPSLRFLSDLSPDASVHPRKTGRLQGYGLSAGVRLRDSPQAGEADIYLQVIRICIRNELIVSPSGFSKGNEP
jgi:hypothetical protein